MVAQAPGLLYCPQLAGYISACQSTYGKKVLLSIGGATSQISFTGEDQAKDFGDVLWNLFGPPGNVDDGLRPFGNVEVDGFDIGECTCLILLPENLEDEEKAWCPSQFFNPRGGWLILELVLNRLSIDLLLPSLVGNGRMRQPGNERSCVESTEDPHFHDQ